MQHLNITVFNLSILEGFVSVTQQEVITTYRDVPYILDSLVYKITSDWCVLGREQVNKEMFYTLDSVSRLLLNYFGLLSNLVFVAFLSYVDISGFAQNAISWFLEVQKLSCIKMMICRRAQARATFLEMKDIRRSISYVYVKTVQCDTLYEIIPL